MRHENSVFHQIQQPIPWSVFDRLVDEHKADHRVRRLTTKAQFLALLFGQLSGAGSLREIEAGLSSHAARLYHVGGRPVARATLADANARRPADVFSKLFSHMAAHAGRRTRRHLGDSLRVLDATRVKLSSLSQGWADMIGGKHAAKLHITYDPNADAPLSMALTGQRTNDITPAKKIAIEPGVTYVFDLGYYDFAWWARIDRAKACFVTRLKSHTIVTTAITAKDEAGGATKASAARRPATVSAGRSIGLAGKAPADATATILSDRIGHLPKRMAGSRRNPFHRQVREITVRISTGKVIRLVTNDLDAPAQEIAGLYKQRWRIELFFKWIKQNLKIRHFLGASENAVRIQVFVALIAYLLLRAAQACQLAITKPLAFARLVRLNIMHRRPIDTLKRAREKPKADPSQFSLPLTGS
ncbi:IS4 family transposase (plasmid) [Rhizobium sp. ACO-34A]|nr:IS4 family transposase [Rhizobium sp. ACO-34A]ATN37084.1 IS4 family transposase [Rhizobium sp. ACO-34A]